MRKAKDFILTAAASSLMTTLILLFMLQPLNKFNSPAQEIIPIAFAQTQSSLPTITGSPNVAVAIQRANSDTYILGADGSVTNSAGTKLVNDYNDSTPVAIVHNSGSDRVAGAAGVATGFALEGTRWYILFADGSVRSK